MLDTSLASSECHVTVCQVTIVTASVWLDRYGSCDSVNANPDTHLLSPVEKKPSSFLSFVTGSTDSVMVYSHWLSRDRERDWDLNQEEWVV